MIAILMMQFERLIVLEHLLAAGATPMLLLQDFSTKRRRRLERQLALAVLKIRFPWGSKGCASPLSFIYRCGVSASCTRMICFLVVGSVKRHVSPGGGGSRAQRASDRFCWGDGVGPIETAVARRSGQESQTSCDR